MRTLFIALALLTLATGCQTVGTCERLAVAEEQHHFEQGNPVYRVHYYWWDTDKAAFVGHAVNYLRHPDGTRTFYDVAEVEDIPAPSPRNIAYDSYDVRVIDGVVSAPTVEPRRGRAGR
jgi:hypothetical protein